MKTKNLMTLAAVAAWGLSACSHNSQSKETTASSIPEAGALITAPHSQRINRTAKQPQRQVAKAMDLHYGGMQQHRRAVQVQRPAQAQYAGYAPTTRSVPQANRANIPSYLPRSNARAQNRNNSVPQLSRSELRAIGQQIFVNEGGGNMNRLVHWNVGEDFAAMGIGHFTWYPNKRRQRFGNTFPGLLDHMVSKGVQLPAWLKQARHSGAPWRSRSEFLRDKDSPRVKQLQQLLYNTREIQAEYIVSRARRAMPKLVKASSAHQRQNVARNLNAVANTPGGWYALIDYVNFKGEGLGNGGYKGQSWGLRQVLEEMRPSQPGRQSLHEFADAAMRVLNRRVRNSNPARNEARWLRGWQNRVNTYRNPVV
uniref:Lipoprotein n=1 Tax=uncultured Thiotrichaceae bacterium TaxID=298394 RepID=A0A6S6UK61_9GAMM|nr:MAG: Unknown protein [uncultured Thiotrichaceae bacterium]